MLRWKKRIRKTTYILTDILTLLIAFILAEIVFVQMSGSKVMISGFERIAFVMLYIMFLVLMNLMMNVYENTIEDSDKISKKTALKMIISFLLTQVFIGAQLFYMKVDFPRSFLIYYALIYIGLLIVNRIIFKQFTGKRVSDKNKRSILVVGYSKNGQKYIDEIKKHEYLNFKIIGYCFIKESQSYEELKTIGCIDELGQIVLNYVVDEVVVARPLSYDSRIGDALQICQDMGITVTMLLETHNKDTKAQVAMVGDLPVLKFHTVSLNENQIFVKRVLDVCGSFVGLILFGIAYVLIGPLIKLESPGPIIFKQDRVGRNGRIFKVWKFRSMGANAEQEKAALMSDNEMIGHMFKMTHDPRITKIGAFIRKTSIDELPQFINVLSGDMSLVGTRPPTVKEVKEYEIHHRRRISITPGITGNWQVSGRSEIEDFEEVVRLDEEYIKNWTIFRDIKILLKTVLVVLKLNGSR